VYGFSTPIALRFKLKKRHKPRHRKKILTFDTDTCFSWNFLIWKIRIVSRYYDQNFVSGVANYSGTRSKMKQQWRILTMLLCFSYQVRKTIHNSTYALKTSWNVCLPSKRNCLEKSSFFIEIRFFKSRCMDSQNWFTVIQAKRDTKQRLKGKILTFATWTLFSQKFFSWKAGITSRYYSKVFASRDAHCSGTRSKATLSKCTTFISFCFSYQNIGWHPTQNLDHNTSIWSLSFKQKKIHEKSVPVAKVTIFLLRHGLYLYFGLNHSNISADNPYPLSVKIISLWKTKIFPRNFLLDRYTSQRRF
jgi:hypothetical protein